MGVDVVTEIEISRSVPDVAAFASDPDNATSWYRNIKSAEWQTPRPLALGSRFSFVASFLGRRLEYVYEVVEFRPAELLRMRTADGPFPMETTYSWEPSPSGATRMRLRNRGEPRGFARIGSAAMAAAMKRANNADLKSLKRVLEVPP